ncbi:MAG TPA: cation transporter, partial [Elusimicrobiales bacterium]|nr:cation transporter [Elusimicrobiales bacterium]
MHDHHNDPDHAARRSIKAAFLVTALIAAVEAAGGLLTGSMALLSDALHMLTDVTGLAVSFTASKLSGMAPDDRRSFGYRR